jgi:hypothetical protein
MTKEEYLNRYFEARHMGLRAVASDAWDAALSDGAPDILEALIALHAVASVECEEDYAAVTNAAAVIAKATAA